MYDSIFGDEDRKQIENHGLTLENIFKQIEIIRGGTPYVKLLRPCTPGDGILFLDKNNYSELMELHMQAAKAGRLMKFIPASGAASRMFRNLTWFYRQPDEVRQPLEKKRKEDKKFGAISEVLNNLNNFAFFEDLKKVMLNNGLVIEELISSGNFQEILSYLLTEKGLNYNNLPKALLKFHKYSGSSRSALEEHIVETLAYSHGITGNCRLHFSVSPEHKEAFQKHISEVGEKYKSRVSNLEITLSEQSPSTDTIAVDTDNRPLRDENGRLIFRPGGHGALLENLNNLHGDIVFLKNVDNVVVDREKGVTLLSKKLLIGYLIRLQNTIFRYLDILERKDVSSKLIHKIMDFCKTSLNIHIGNNFTGLNNSEKVNLLSQYLNRPIRVCGMVKNRGEAGGGPFWVVDFDGRISPQIVEISQIDKSSPVQLSILESATHFNPVFLACGLRNHNGIQFNLFDFRDPRTVFIAKKYMDGHELKALEWPGLWNGSMAYWISVFVEVPSEVFNPVKTINDLLKDKHRN